MEVSKTANGWKCKRSVLFSENGRKEHKECVVERWGKAAVMRKKAAWKEVLTASEEKEEEEEERCMEAYREEKRKAKLK